MWSKTVRILPTRFPPIDLFERIAPPEDREALIAVECLTNPRIRQEAGDISLVSIDERVSGPGASWVMAAFTHLGRPSRFGDGSFGIYYTARTERCAIAETRFHWARFLRATNEGVTSIDMRVLIARLDATLIDVRANALAQADSRKRRQRLHHPEDYTASQRFGQSAREAGANGIVYDSVRLPGDQCAALFRPKCLKQLPQSSHVLRYRFDGNSIHKIFDYRSEEWREFDD